MRENNIKILKDGGIGVLGTDTLYGLVGRADSPQAVERVSKVKGRSDGKGFIVLISSIEDLKDFGVEIPENVSVFLNKFWPGKVSVSMTAAAPGYEYLRFSDGTIAFRLPDKESLVSLLKETGPLIAPSANPEGKNPAKNIHEAKEYFDQQVDFYEDSGNLDSLPSTLVKISTDNIEVIREGAVKI